MYCAKSFQLCPTLCDPMVCSPPGSSVHVILQARILEWVAMPFSRGIFLIQGSNQDLNLCLLGLLHWQRVLYHEHHLLVKLKCWQLLRLDQSQEDKEKQQIERKLKEKNSKNKSKYWENLWKQMCFFEKNKNWIILWHIWSRKNR